MLFIFTAHLLYLSVFQFHNHVLESQRHTSFSVVNKNIICLCSLIKLLLHFLLTPTIELLSEKPALRPSIHIVSLPNKGL